MTQRVYHCLMVQRRALLLLLICLLAIPASAALSPELKEWGDGPAQWIMTADEKRAWRKLATDADAIAFIDLFWARRDPTAGTLRNEFRNEFTSRVTFADEKFTERRKRGALTDRGRVYIVLGTATNLGTELRQSSQDQGADATAGSRVRGARETWRWENQDARQFDMARIEVVFNEDPVTNKVQRDPRRADFAMAESVAIRKAVVHPEMTTLPEWAAVGGLEPAGRAPVVVAELIPETPAAPAGEPAPAPSTAVIVSKPGLSNLILLRGSLNLKSADPLAIQAQTAFVAGKDIVWAAQFCSNAAETPKLTSMMVINGPLGAGSREQATRPANAKLELIAARPGCYVLQGSAPVAKFAPGRYRINILADDVKTQDAFSVKGEFRLE